MSVNQKSYAPASTLRNIPTPEALKSRYALSMLVKLKPKQSKLQSPPAAAPDLVGSRFSPPRRPSGNTTHPMTSPLQPFTRRVAPRHWSGATCGRPKYRTPISPSFPRPIRTPRHCDGCFEGRVASTTAFFVSSGTQATSSGLDAGRRHRSRTNGVTGSISRNKTSQSSPPPRCLPVTRLPVATTRKSQNAQETITGVGGLGWSGWVVKDGSQVLRGLLTTLPAPSPTTTATASQPARHTR
jgi:hypothetical protein